MARIPLEHPRTPVVRFTTWMSRRRFGKVPDPALALLHNPRVMGSLALLEARVPGWRSLDPTLKALAIMAPSTQIGCAWCMDFGYWEFANQGVDRRKIEDVPVWRTSDAYTPLERQVLEYAEAMTATPPEVTDEMVAGLRESLSDAQLVELTSLVSLENLRSRTNAALGLTSQGFKASCELGPA